MSHGLAEHAVFLLMNWQGNFRHLRLRLFPDEPAVM
jgi:hypothetical protein